MSSRGLPSAQSCQNSSAVIRTCVGASVAIVSPRESYPTRRVGYLWGVHVAIIGLGGIGASVGLAVQHEALGWGVVGYDIAPDALEGALQIGAIDHPAESIAACADADLIVIATPPLAMPECSSSSRPACAPKPC